MNVAGIAKYNEDLTQVCLAASQLPLAREPRISAGRGIVRIGSDCGSGDNRGNGRGKQCKDALNVCAQSFAGRETIQAHTAPHPTGN